MTVFFLLSLETQYYIILEIWYYSSYDILISKTN